MLTRSQFLSDVSIKSFEQLIEDIPASLTGHCFRTGGTTFYLISGVLDMAKKFGWWRFRLSWNIDVAWTTWECFA